MADDLKWFYKTIVADGPHVAVWVNGYQVTDWTDTRPADPNPRKGLRARARHDHDPRPRPDDESLVPQPARGAAGRRLSGSRMERVNANDTQRTDVASRKRRLEQLISSRSGRRPVHRVGVARVTRRLPARPSTVNSNHDFIVRIEMRLDLARKCASRVGRRIDRDGR